MAEGVAAAPGSPRTGDESSESENETEPAKIFHRKLSTKRNVKSAAASKEGYLMKQTWSFQRWRRRYFRLKGHKLYYAKDSKVGFNFPLFFFALSDPDDKGLLGK
uniref:Diacylglycerol kinase eta n=1 Tax=Culex pipiens TaxID=7175 RepID=A0A8D8FDX3_CULPI